MSDQCADLGYCDACGVVRHVCPAWWWQRAGRRVYRCPECDHVEWESVAAFVRRRFCR